MPHIFLKIKNSGLASLFFIGCLIMITACQPQPTQRQVTYSGPIMGTEYRISVLLAPEFDLQALEQQLVASMQAVNQSMSTYISDSELNQLNKIPAGQDFTLSAQLAEVLTASSEVSRLSDGAFDVTLASVINLWGFGPTGRVETQPSDAELAELKQSTGYQKLRLKDGVAVKSHDNLSIDLSAIAKGYAVDQVAETLLSQGIDNFLVDVGGELRASGRKSDMESWKVGIEKPHALGGIQEIAMLDNAAIATSGDYRNFYLIDGKSFSHTIDSSTLKPVFHKLALVSVISDTTMRADALATAMLAMGEVRAEQFANEHDLAAYLLIREEGKDQYRSIVTDKFKAVLQ